MRICKHTNGISCEFEMQAKLNEWLVKKELTFIDEMFISEISRRPDFLVQVPGNGLINIEAKCNNLNEMLLQLKDNSVYCDYSFAYIPDYSIVSKYVKNEILKNGFGLFVYNKEVKIVTEALEAHKNKGVNRSLQKAVLHRIKMELIKRKQQNHIDTQQILELK